NIIPVTLRLNIVCGYRRMSGDLLLEIAHGNVERAAGKKIRGSIMVARLGKLPVCSGAREKRKTQGSNKHDKGQHNDQRSAFGFAVMRMKELFHGVTTFIRLGGYWETLK